MAKLARDTNLLLTHNMGISFVSKPQYLQISNTQILDPKYDLFFLSNKTKILSQMSHCYVNVVYIILTHFATRGENQIHNYFISNPYIHLDYLCETL